MPTSRRESILANVETVLRTITTANGYAHDIGTVERGEINPLNLQAYPCALILPMGDRPEAMASSVSRRDLSITIRLWVKPHANLSEALELLITDVQTALMADPRRGGHAENTLEGELSYLYLDSEALEAGADVEYLIHYRTAIGNPASGPA
jgi:hypothetical protein